MGTKRAADDNGSSEGSSRMEREDETPNASRRRRAARTNRYEEQLRRMQEQLDQLNRRSKEHLEFLVSYFMYIHTKADEARAKGEVDLDTEWIAGFEPAQETQLYKEIYDDIKLVHSEPAYEEDCKMAAYVRYRRIMKTKRQEEEEEQRQQEGQENGSTPAAAK